MDQVESVLRSVLVQLCRLLDPLIALLAQLEAAVRAQLTQFGVPYQWLGPIVAAAWVIVVFMLVRIVPGWLRMVVLLVVALVLLRIYGMLPV